MRCHSCQINNGWYELKYLEISINQCNKKRSLSSLYINVVSPPMPEKTRFVVILVKLIMSGVTYIFELKKLNLYNLCKIDYLSDAGKAHIRCHTCHIYNAWDELYLWIEKSPHIWKEMKYLLNFLYNFKWYCNYNFSRHVPIDMPLYTFIDLSRTCMSHDLNGRNRPLA
jgi:hypothetical protein